MCYGDASSWREKIVKEYLAIGNNVKFLNPLRGKGPYLKSLKYNDPAEDADVMVKRKSIVIQDCNDIRMSDAIVANFNGAEQVSIGTVFEIAIAYELKKPIITVMEDSNIHQHAFIKEASTFIVATTKEAALTLKTLFGE